MTTDFIKVGETYTSRNWNEWLCIYAEDDLRWLKCTTDPAHSSAYVWRADGEPVSLKTKSSYTIDPPVAEPDVVEETTEEMVRRIVRQVVQEEMTPTRTWAKAEHVPSNIKYIKQGKWYLTGPGDSEMSFVLLEDEDGDRLNRCLWNECSLLRGYNWTRYDGHTPPEEKQ